MAGVAGAWAQAGLIVELRWWLLRNSLRTTRGQLELMAQTVGALVGALAGVGIGIWFGVMAYMFHQPRRLMGPALLLWLIFLFWQLAPVLLAVGGAQFDFRGLLHFPLRFSAFWWLSVVYGLFDPTGLLALLWLGFFTLGLLAAQPAGLLGVAPVLALFAAANLLIGRAAFSWLERLLATRRAREVAGAAALMVFLGIQFVIPLVLAGWKQGKLPFLVWLLPLAELLPPQLAGRAVVGALAGDWLAVLRGTAGLAAYGLGFGLLFTRRLRALYRGEELSDARAPERQGTLVVREGWPRTQARRLKGACASALHSAWVRGWRASGVAPAVAAVMEKEVRYALRNSPLMMNLAMPPFFLAFLTLPMALAEGKEAGFLFGRLGGLLFPAAVAYSLLIFLAFGYNTFAYDGAGVQLWLTAPVRMREVLMGKNLAHAALVGLEAALLYAAVSVLIRPPGALVTLATLAALPSVLLVNYTVGNLMSVYFPRRFEFGTFKGQRPAGMTILVSLLVEGAVLGLAALVFMAGALADLLWAAAVVFLALGWLAWRLYGAVLLECEKVAQRKREVLLAELCKT